MSLPHSRLSDLAFTVVKGVAILEQFYHDKSVQPPSFEPGTPSTYDYDDGARKARAAVLESVDELMALLLGPTEPWLSPPVSCSNEAEALAQLSSASVAHVRSNMSLAMVLFKPYWYLSRSSLKLVISAVDSVTRLPQEDAVSLSIVLRVNWCLGSAHLPRPLAPVECRWKRGPPFPQSLVQIR